MRTDLRVKKQRQTRIEKSVDLTVDEIRRRLLEVVDLQVERPAQSYAQIIVKCRNGKCGVEPVEIIIDIQGVRGACKNAQAESRQLHATALTPFAAEKCTSNSVQSFSERTRHKSPPCSRASSRAKFKPIP